MNDRNRDRASRLTPLLVSLLVVSCGSDDSDTNNGPSDAATERAGEDGGPSGGPRDAASESARDAAPTSAIDSQTPPREAGRIADAGLLEEAATEDAGAIADVSVGEPADSSDAVAVEEPEATTITYPEASTCAGYAMQFDTFGSFIRIARPVQDDFTLEAWIKMNAPSLTSTNAAPGFWEGNGLLYADTPNVVANDFGTSILNNHFTFGTGNPDSTLIGTSDVATGQWVHVAATRARALGEKRIYVNGVQEGILTGGNTLPLSSELTLVIGANANEGRYFGGVIDEVRIWSVVRTPAEIAASARQRLTGSEAGLVRYYRFDQPSQAEIVSDAPSDGGDTQGAIFGNVTWVPSEAPLCDPVPEAGLPDSGTPSPVGDAAGDAGPLSETGAAGSDSGPEDAAAVDATTGD
jgi:hypothetical protein